MNKEIPAENPGPLQTFEDNLAKGEFKIQQCKECGQHVFYPRQLCSHCGSSSLKWSTKISGRGTVYSIQCCKLGAWRRLPTISLIDLEEEA